MIAHAIVCLLLLPVNEPPRASTPAEQLTEWLTAHELSDANLAAVADEEFAQAALSKADAETAAELIWAARKKFLQADRAAEMERREIVIGDLTMPFWFERFGSSPDGGRSLFISLHGGGNAAAKVNDQQYENQKRLYVPEEGIYLVPRAPTNTWDLWHQSHIDKFFDRLITNMIVLEDVNPDRVYLLGYSAGGDGVYQVAPRMADRFAAASMMAGHPNETQPAGLRNLGFAIHVGSNDNGYERNAQAERWKQQLADLHAGDPNGYHHEVTLHEGLGHWMKRKDAVALPWMAQSNRRTWPNRIVWRQDDVLHSRFYWLQVPPDSATAGDEVVAEARDQTIHIEKSAAKKLSILASDELFNLDQPLRVVLPDGTETEHRITRTIASLAASLLGRNDPNGMYSGTAVITLH